MGIIYIYIWEYMYQYVLGKVYVGAVKMGIYTRMDEGNLMYK